MATSVHTGSFNITTGAAASTVAVTGVGFTPKAIIFWWSGRTESTDAGGSATSVRGTGFAVSASSFCAVCTRDLDGGGSANTDNGHRDDACVLELGDGALIGWADIQSMDADGFTLEILDAFSIDLRVRYIAYGGSDITNAEIGRFTAAGTAPVNQSATNSGFQPDITFMLAAQLDPPAANAASLYCFGVAMDASNEYVMADRASNGVGSGDTYGYALAGECIGFMATGGDMQDRAEFVSHDASGFTVNWLDRVGAPRIYWLSIKGGEWKVGDLLTQTDTTTDITESGFGFAPSGVLFASVGRAASTADVTTVNAKWSLGAATSASNRGAQAIGSRDGNTNMFTQTFIEFDEVYINIDPATDSIIGLMDVKSFDSDGFTAIMDDADPAQAFVWYVAAGNVAVGGFVPFPRPRGLSGGLHTLSGGMN